MSKFLYLFSTFLMLDFRARYPSACLETSMTNEMVFMIALELVNLRESQMSVFPSEGHS